MGEKPTMLFVPESAANFREVGFIEERAIARRLQVDAADFTSSGLPAE